MTKRILAIVMALVLSLSLLTVEMFAETYTGEATVEVSGSSLKISWNKGGNLTNVERYNVRVFDSSRDYYNSSVGKDTSVTVTPGAYGTFNVEVTAYDSSNSTIGIFTGKGTINPSSTYNGITVTSVSDSKVKVSWASKADIKQYYVIWTGKTSSDSGNKTVNNSGTACEAEIDLAYDKIASIVVKEYYSSGATVGTWYPSSTPNPSGSNVTLDSGYLNWKSVPTAGNYRVTYAVNNGSEYDVNNSVEYMGTYYRMSVANILSRYSTSTVVFRVYYKTSSYSSWYYFDSYTYNPGYGNAVYLDGNYLRWKETVAPYRIYLNGTEYKAGIYANYYDVSEVLKAFGSASITFIVRDANGAEVGRTGNIGNPNPNSGSYNFRVSVSSGYINLSWNSVYGATDYYVVYAINNVPGSIITNGATAASIPYTQGRDYVEIEVYTRGTYGGYGNLIGAATVNTSGYVSYTSNPYTPSTTPSGGTTVQGDNCYAVVSSDKTVLYWNNSGYADQRVAYIYDGKYYEQSVGSASSATIPLGAGKTFTAYVVRYGATVASVTVNGNNTSLNGNGNFTKSETHNLVLTEVSGGTKISWEPVSGASYYLVEYMNLTSTSSQQIVSMSTSATIPFTKRNGFQVYVYAQMSYATGRNVGYAVHIAGDEYNSSSLTPEDNKPTVSEYVTGFKATSGSKKITLSWNAASGNPKYEVQWKRSSASEWKKAGETTKRAANITGLNNGVSYDFRIKANGKYSGVVTISPQASGTTTKTAPDPTGAGTTTSTVPVITSIEGGSGKMTITWNGVKNGTNYQVWIAKSDSKTYAISTHKDYYPNAVTTISGTTATITGLPAGTYKVRLKASADNGKTYTALADCEVRTVTVK